MPILKAEFDDALALQADALAARQLSQVKRNEARDKEQELSVVIGTWGGLDSSDPFTVRLVEHEGDVYRVTPTDIKVLSTDATEDPPGPPV